MSVTLQVNSLSAGYRRKPVIRDLTLPAIEGGQITALVGPNAAGKSTLLRALAGLLPAKGEVLLNDRNILTMSAPQRGELVGFMPQTIPQGTALTVLEGMLSALRAGGMSPGETPLHRAVAVLKSLGIGHLAMSPFGHLSGGQRQLASFAQAIVRTPSLLLLDEPTSALDLRHQFELMSAVKDYTAAGRAVVIVLHDLALAARWAETIVVMADGSVAKAGTPIEALSPETIRRVYGVDATVSYEMEEVRIVVRGLAAD